MVKNSSLGNVANGWPDWHQLWCTHADSSRKGSWPNKISGGGGGGLGLGGGGGGGRGSEIQKSEKAHVVNTHTHAYSSTKGSRPIGGGGGQCEGAGGGGGGRGSEIQVRKSTCEHTCIFIYKG